jgi:hypothetical protein
MKLVQTFQTAIKDPANWYEHNGMATVNWNFVDADCYMACGNDYPNPDAFYDEWNALCDIYCATQAFDRMEMIGKIKVDSVAA